jgi:hypothetical protein
MVQVPRCLEEPLLLRGVLCARPSSFSREKFPVRQAFWARSGIQGAVWALTAWQKDGKSRTVPEGFYGKSRPPGPRFANRVTIGYFPVTDLGQAVEAISYFFQEKETKACKQAFTDNTEHLARKKNWTESKISRS